MMRAALICFLRKITYGVIFIALAAPVVAPPKTNACACCSNPGTWYESTDETSEYVLNEISSLKFSRKAKLYVTEADLPEGLEEIEPESDDYAYDLTQTQNGRQWELKLKTKAGKTGSLSFTIPSTMVSFAVDLHDGTDRGTGPALYKEWRFKGAVDGTGVFKKSMTGKREFRLVLQGRGNSCTDASNFTHWNLSVAVAAGEYSFYGSFDQPK
jgi:hypothetical protein